MAITVSKEQQLLIPAFYVQQILDQLQDHSEEIQQFFARHQLVPENLSQTNSLIRLDTFKLLIVYAIELTQKQSLGLLVGRNLSLTTHGMLGFAVMASRTIREALALIARYLDIRTPLLGLNISEQTEYVEVQLSERYCLDAIQRPLLESAVSALHSMLEQIAAELKPIIKIRLPFSEPAYVSEYRFQFNCEVEFSAAKASLLIASKVLDVPLKLGNESAFNNAVEICEKELINLKEGQTVQHKIRTILLESKEKFPNLNQTASQLHLSPRTMHRCLEKEQTTFSRILSEVRYLRAQSMLSSTRLSIAEIGRQLGYSEPASFRKAFRNWSNMSPKEFRNQDR